MDQEGAEQSAHILSPLVSFLVITTRFHSVFFLFKYSMNIITDHVLYVFAVSLFRNRFSKYIRGISKIVEATILRNYTLLIPEAVSSSAAESVFVVVMANPQLLPGLLFPVPWLPL